MKLSLQNGWSTNAYGMGKPGYITYNDRNARENATVTGLTHNHLVRKRTLNHLANGGMFVYELSGCGFEQGVPWHSGIYRMWSHSKTRTWHDKNTKSRKNALRTLGEFFEIIRNYST